MGTIAATKKQTYRDYEALPEGAPFQLIDGELVMTPSQTVNHQQIIRNLAVLLHHYITERALGEVIFAPIDVCLTEDDVYQPDVIFISNERKQIIQERIKGVPDLIVEVLSPSNAYLDLVRKKNVCEATGVREYWIVDPMEKSIDVFENIGKEFRNAARARHAGTVTSKILSGFTVSLDQCFQT